MRSLILFLLKNFGFFYFILLETVCLFLIISFNPHQREIFIYSANQFSGFLSEKSNEVSDFVELKEINQDLLYENAKLRQRLSAMKQQKGLQPDIIASDTNARYIYYPAKVVNNSIQLRNNTMTIDIGTKDGIGKEMAVVTDDGIAGITLRANDNFASVLSVLNSHSRISCRIKGSGFIGTLRWYGPDPRIFSLEGIPRHAKVVVGDTVETNGFSAIFPEGIFIGKVSDIRLESGANYYDLSVVTKTDLSKVEYVYVIKNLDKLKREEVENRPVNE